MDPRDIARYRRQVLANPPAFVEGVQGMFKQAGLSETWDSVKLPLLLTLLTYGGMKAGTAWGRYANSTGNPNGPVKGPLLKVIEAALPKDRYFVYKGTPEYDDIMAYRTAQDGAKWDKMFNNAVSEGRAKSLTMRTDHA